jgi:hypothetical protein
MPVLPRLYPVDKFCVSSSRLFRFAAEAIEEEDADAATRSLVRAQRWGEGDILGMSVNRV